MKPPQLPRPTVVREKAGGYLADCQPIRDRTDSTGSPATDLRQHREPPDAISDGLHNPGTGQYTRPELFGVVQAREGSALRNRDAEELAQRPPALLHLVVEQPVGGTVRWTSSLCLLKTSMA